MKNFFLVLFCLLPFVLTCQIVTTSPTFPISDQPLTISVDVTGTSLADFTAYNATTNPVYIWTWIKKSGSSDFDAPSNKNPGLGNAAADPAKCIRISTNVYQITFTPTTFFGKIASEIPQIGFKLKTSNWNDNKQTDVDKFITFTSGFAVQLSQPSTSSFFVNTGDQIPIVANASQSSNLVVKINGSAVAMANSATTISYSHNVTETSGSVSVVIEANNGSETKSVSFTYTLRSATVNAPIPIGIKNGINYFSDKTKATLRLWAPGKSSVYVLGDFNDWSILSTYQMKKSGEYFWLDITGLTDGTEYAFQYLVDENVRIADPYADKILDPDDQYIPAATYPNLKPFPVKAITDKWYFNRTSVLQTGQTPYLWQTTAYQKPSKEKLVIYELHIRDFFDTGKKNYQNLIDTLSYFKKLGINAIELMPITEFSGNDSWGYNPNFMFAPDKFYGTKNKLKEFIDKCHKIGIAIIMDMVMNQQDLPNPYLMIDFDFVNFKPTANNKWFNTKATHPYNVFYDLNHESTYTKAYLDTINYYWLNEYKVDGFRYDLSKGFTSVNYCTTTNCDTGPEVSAWSGYDASRIAILKRMADQIWAHSPNAYIILEHFADNSEERELAEYRSVEGKGMLLWANFNAAFNQNTMGFGSSNDISNMYYANRSWSVPGAVGYMESHDEERLMYKNAQTGNFNASYSSRTLTNSLNRMKAANVIFYSIPGPKMLWQFGELGYDKSINTCTDGTTISNNCRTYPKPIKWDYQQVPERKSLYDLTSTMIGLRNRFSVFSLGDATIIGGSTLIKQVMLKNRPYNASPSTTESMNAVSVANFDIVTQIASINFPHQGIWFDYFNQGITVAVTSSSQTVELLPGEYKIYTDVQVDRGMITSIEDLVSSRLVLYPNPTNGLLKVEGISELIESINVISIQGVKSLPTRIDETTWDVKQLPAGLYIVEINTASSSYRKRIIKY